MEIYPDFRELLVLLNRRKVEFVVVGGYALAFHGLPRYTGDMDLFIHATVENAERLLQALRDFGYPAKEVTPEEFQQPGKVFMMGRLPVRIDFLTSIDGVSWEQAEKGKSPGQYGGVDVFYIGRKEFLANKEAAGRPKDLVDVLTLKKQEQKKKRKRR